MITPPITSLVTASVYDILSNPGHTIYIVKPMIIEIAKQDSAERFKYSGYVL